MRVPWLGMLFCLLAASPTTAQSGQSAGPPPQSSPQPRAVGEIDDLALADLLDSTVSIAAGRIQRVEEAPSIVSVIAEEDIRRLGARTLQDVLELIPGIEVLTDNVGRSRIVVRGIATTTGVSESVLVLFNGVRVNEQLTGGATTLYLDIPLYNVKQIEIIRGPGSARYGANAFLAVINVVTHTSATFHGIDVSAGFGSFATQEYGVTTGHTLGDVGVATSFQFTKTDGAQQLIGADAHTVVDQLLAQFGLPPVSLAPGPAETDKRAVDFMAHATYKALVVNARIHDESAGAFVGRVDSLGTRSVLDNRQILLGVGYRSEFTPRAGLGFDVNFAQNEIRENLNPLPPGFSRPLPTGGLATFPAGILVDFSNNSRRFGAGATFDYQFSPATELSVGGAFERESTFDLESFGNFDATTGAALPALQLQPFTFIPESTRTIASAFVQQSFEVGRTVAITAGARYDHYSDFGNTLNPRAGLVWRLPRSFHVKALYGRAFRAPSFYEQFLALPVVLLGNSELKPATIHTGELALGYRRRNLRLTANYFATRIRDFIASTRPLTPEGILGTSTFVNTPGLNVQGLEVEFRRDVGLDHSVFANYTYQHPEDRSGIRRADVPSHLANLGVTAGLGRYASVSPTLLVRGSRPRQPGDPRENVEGYAVMNVNVRLLNFWDTMEVSARIENLFDTVYVDPAPLGGVPVDYPAPGTSVIVRASYKF